MSLYIYAKDTDLKQLLINQVQKQRSTDSGFDIPMLSLAFDELCSFNNYSLKLGIQVAATHDDGTTAPCLLLPRSSIGTTPFRLVNSIGLIDQGYRGEVQAKVDSVHPVRESWSSGTRMFQLCRHNFLPWNSIVIVSSLDELPSAPDTRGDGGFGSTGS